GDYSPAGRLPVTFYKSVNQLPPFDDYRMAGRTYRYFTGEPLFPFGFGLSYSTFAYSGLTAPKETKTGESLSLSVSVKNTGRVSADEVVEVYLKHLGAPAWAPLRSLAGFKRVSLKPGETRSVSFTLTPRQLSLIDEQFKRVVEPGDVEISIGGSLPGEAGQPVGAKVKLIGERFEVTPR